MADTSLCLLGSTGIKMDALQIAVKHRKALALLFYVAVTAERQARDSLPTLLWPKSSQRHDRKFLRNRHSELKRVLEGEWIEADRESVGLRTGFWLAVAEIQDYLAENIGSPQALIAAVDLYRPRG